jgi:hypothetical protein
MERSIMTIQEFKEIFIGQPPVDKKEWEDGPWQNEPDYEIFEYKELPCFIQRHKTLGVYKGYVLIPLESYLFSRSREAEALDDIEVHGGITFTYQTALGYLIGFDCGHPAEDIIPYSAMGFAEPQSEQLEKELKKMSLGATYKDIEFVRNELKNLVDQIIEKLPCQEPTSLHEAAT